MLAAKEKKEKEPAVVEFAVAQTTETVCDMNRIVDQYGKYLVRMAFIMLKDRCLAEDAVQESLLKVYKFYKPFEDDNYEKNWILRITINTCKDMLRRSWYSRIDDSAALETIPISGNLDVSDDTPLKEVMKLSPIYKEVILLFYYQDRKIKDIAQVLNISENTVSTRLKRARALLEDQLKGWYFDET